MNILTGRRLNRRTFFAAQAHVFALPLLDAMIPARATAAAMRTPVRLGFFYFPERTDYGSAHARYGRCRL